jgi:hypothetical protein
MGSIESSDLDELYESLLLYEPARRQYVICDEADAQWRQVRLSLSLSLSMC